MGFYKASTKAEDIKEGGNGGKYINKSGIYDVVINRAFVDVNDSGARTINLFINHKDQDQVIYGNLRLDNNNGDANEIGTKTFNKLCIIANVEDIEDPETEDLPIGKKGAEKAVDVLHEFDDVECKLRINLEYGVYKNNITEKTNITGFYSVDGATAEEIINETEAGITMEKDQEYAQSVKYNNDLTEADIAEWIKAKRPKGTGGGAGAPATATKAPSFGKKKFGK